MQAEARKSIIIFGKEYISENGKWIIPIQGGLSIPVRPLTGEQRQMEFVEECLDADFFSGRFERVDHVKIYSKRLAFAYLGNEIPQDMVQNLSCKEAFLETTMSFRNRNLFVRVYDETLPSNQTLTEGTYDMHGNII